MNKYLWLASAFLCIVSSSCTKDIEKDYAGNQVVFTARTGALDTRTEYGVSETVSGTEIQYVDWVDGDDITILMSPGSSANYAITKETDGGSGSYSRATITAKQGSTALEWGSSGEYDFYAMYPAAGTVPGTSLTTSTMTAVIPDTWTPTDETIGKLPYGYMFAKAEDIANQSEEVVLRFNPTFTAFCFTLKNSTGNPIKLTSLSLKSISKAMSGTYGVSTSDGTITLGSSNTNKTITVDFTSLTDEGFVVPSGTERTVTVATLPDTFNDLTVSITRYGDSDPKELPLKKSNSYLTFAAGKKHNLNISLPDYTYTFTVTDPELSYNAVTTVGTVVSKNSNNAPIPWFVEGYYATEEDARSGQNRSATFSGIADSPLGAAIADVTSPSSTSTEVLPVVSTPVSMTLAEYINENIKNSSFGEGSSSSVYYNLSNPTNMTSSTVVESANCYIVNGPGYFRIPLIMGNGAYNADFVNYKGNTINNDAYLHNQGGTPTTAKVLWEDVDGLINGMEDSDKSTHGWVLSDGIDGDWLQFYIDKDHIQQGNAVIAIYDGTTSSAKVMWSYHIWVTDYVPANYTNNPFPASYTPPADIVFTNTNSPAVTYTISPYNVGWVVTSSTTKAYKHGVVYVRLRQETSGNYAIMKIDRPEHVLTLSGTSLNTGYCTYYQWGRTAPHYVDYNTYGYDSGGTYNNMYGKSVSASSTNTVDHVQAAILYPGKYISSYLDNKWGNNANAPDVRKNTLVRALWNLHHSTYSETASYPIDEDVVKSMYDPCPVGFYVPPYQSFNGAGSDVSSSLPAAGYLNYPSSHDKTNYYWYNIPTLNGAATTSTSLGISTGSSRIAGIAIRPARKVE